MTDEKPSLIQIPYDQLAPETLEHVIEAFVLREGTDYGAGSEINLETKVEQVRKQLEQKKVFIVYDPTKENVSILTEHEWSRTQSQHAAQDRHN